MFVSWDYSLLSNKLGGDYAQYISQAKAIVNNTVDEFIIDNEFIVDNSSNLLGAVTYPWGLPCILAFLMRLGLDSVFAFHMMEVVCVIGSGLILFWIGYQIEGMYAAISTSALVLLNIVFIKYSAIIATDICFPTLIMIGMGISYVLFYKDNNYEFSSYKRNAFLLLLGWVIFLSSAIRDGGIILLIAVVMQQAMNWIRSRNYTKTGYHICEILLVQFSYWIPRMLFEKMLPLHQESHYDKLFTANIYSLIYNLIGYVKCLWEIFTFPKILSILLLVMVLIIVTIGVLVVSKDLFFLPLIYAAGTLALYCIWPVFIGVRFGFSAFMALLLYLPFGLGWIKSRIAKLRGLRVACICGLCLVLSLFGISTLAYMVKYLIKSPELKLGPYTNEANELFEFVKSSTSEDVVIAFQKPRVMYLNTGRLGMQVDEKDFEEKLARCDYVIDGVEEELGDFDKESLENFDKAHADVLMMPVFENEMFTMYKIGK